MSGRVIRTPGVFIAGREARLLIHLALGGERLEWARRKDRGLAEALDAIDEAGRLWARTDVGTSDAKASEPARAWVTAKEAAAVLNITDRAVRKAIAEGRLPADNTSGPWMIHREQLEIYRTKGTR